LSGCGEAASLLEVVDRAQKGSADTDVHATAH